MLSRLSLQFLASDWLLGIALPEAEIVLFWMARCPAPPSPQWSLHGGKRPIRSESARSGRAGCPLARYERRDSQLPGSAAFLHKRLNY